METKYTKEQIQAAFLKWEREWLANPSGFRSQEELATLTPEQKSEESTQALISFMP